MNDAALLTSLEAATNPQHFMHWAQQLPVEHALVTLARNAPSWALEVMEEIAPTAEELTALQPTPLDWTIMCFNLGQPPEQREVRAKLVGYLAGRMPAHNGPLHLAAAVNFGEAIAPLVAAGHDLRGVNGERMTPLETAFEYLAVEGAYSLIQAGASRSWKGHTGRTMDSILANHARARPENKAMVEMFEMELAMRKQLGPEPEMKKKGRARM